MGLSMGSEEGGGDEEREREAWRRRGSRQQRREATWKCKKKSLVSALSCLELLKEAEED